MAGVLITLSLVNGSSEMQLYKRLIMLAEITVSGFQYSLITLIPDRSAPNK